MPWLALSRSVDPTAGATGENRSTGVARNARCVALADCGPRPGGLGGAADGLLDSAGIDLKCSSATACGPLGNGSAAGTQSSRSSSARARDTRLFNVPTLHRQIAAASW
jgi:hypothetical protein